MITRTIRTKILSLLLAAIMVFSLLPVTALSATVNSTYTPGTYTGTAKVYKNDVIKVTVTLTEGENGVAISAIDAVLESGDQTDVSFLETAKTAILAQIKAKNGTDNIDAVSGQPTAAMASPRAPAQTHFHPTRPAPAHRRSLLSIERSKIITYTSGTFCAGCSFFLCMRFIFCCN